jgi:TonB family protein
LKQWQYQPALLDGRPVGSLLELRFEFKAHLKVITTDASDPYHNLLASIIGPRVTHLLCRPGDLDRPVATLQTVAPAGVGASSGSVAGERVVVDFYVDQDGRIRMPVIMSATHDFLAQAAVDALNQWRFKPPTLAGQPVAVRVEQEFVFSPST